MFESQIKELFGFNINNKKANAVLFATLSLILMMSAVIPVEHQASARCPNGYHKDESGECEKVVDNKGKPRCPDGYHRSPDGDCERVNSDKNSDSKNTDSDSDNKKSSKEEKNKVETKFDTQEENTIRTDMTEGNSTTFHPYRYDTLGVSLEHPPDWIFGSLKNGIQLIKEKNGVYVEIRKHDIGSSNTQLKQYVFDDIKGRSTKRQDLEMLNISETTISGNLPAYKTEYTFLKTVDQKDFTINGTTNKILRFWTFANGNAYTVAYVSDRDNYDLYLPIALNIIDTLKINPQEKNVK